jgi:predicted nucleic acid-binding protein
MAGFVLTDASPLIGLARVDGLHWLQPLFGTVWMPTEVRAEVVSFDSARGFAEEASILNAEQQGWLQVAGPTPIAPALPDLDEGESACIRIALAQAQPALLLMDERAGRAVAQEMGLKVAGTAAIIGMAKSRGLIGSATEVFTRLHGSDFRISAEVIRAILKRVGES